jgi:S-methylmethionine-dependent homocysteine/selenocysteine methylase
LYQTEQSVKTDQSVWNEDEDDHTMESTQPIAALPQLSGRPVVTDGGLETDLIYHHGVDLPEFAAFPLLDDDRGRELLLHYYGEYVSIAARAGVALQLETPTWRASGDWGDRLGYSAADLRRVNSDSVTLLRQLRDDAGLASLLISGCLGPRGDGYVAGDEVDPDAASAYHSPQIDAFAEAGADLISALTLTGTGEAVGIVRVAQSAGLPVAVSFTVEQDGRLPDGTSLAAAITEVDAEGGPDYYMVNCAHPTHIAPGLDDPGEWRSRIVGLRANASTRSHAELDAATELDEGDPIELATAQEALRRRLPNLALVGGCCGTDARHVAAMWGVN